jgi:toxin ParE1/3/4
MRVVYTPAALRDLAAIADWLTSHYPTIAPLVQRRIRAAVEQISRWPESARRSGARRDVRVALVGRYPYKIFYRVAGGSIQILHIHHTAREPWDERM